MSTRFDAYAAGLVDGEGCITAKTTKANTGMGIRVLIGMATKASEVLKRMQSEYSGTLITQTPVNAKHSDVMTWTVTGAEAAAFLNRVLPHLLLKEEQAVLALKIEEIRTSLPQIGTRDHHRWSPEALDRCQQIYRRIMELNERGPIHQEVTPLGGVEIARLVAGTWVTDQADLFSDLGWEPFSGTWPRSGCMSSGQAYELPTSALPIIASGSSFLLPTPRAADPKASMGSPGAARHVVAGMGSLAEVIGVHLPTPTVGNATGTNERRGGARSNEKLLPGIVLDFLPTPKANDKRDSNGAAEARRKSPTLTAVSVHFPTPSALDATGGGSDPATRKANGHHVKLIDAVKGLSGATTLPLFDAGSE